MSGSEQACVHDNNKHAVGDDDGDDSDDGGDGGDDDNDEHDKQ